MMAVPYDSAFRTGAGYKAAVAVAVGLGELGQDRVQARLRVGIMFNFV
jgi:hypothetical protein